MIKAKKEVKEEVKKEEKKEEFNLEEAFVLWKHEGKAEWRQCPFLLQL